MRVRQAVVVEHDSSIREQDVEINTGILESKDVFVDVLIDRLGLRVICYLEGLQEVPE